MAKFCKRLYAIICVVALLAALFGQAGVAGAAPADPYEQMIERWSDYLTGGSQFEITSRTSVPPSTS
ncbi:hypothetical protein [Paenibacillus sp. YN15]|uniref:hypothetical protein n=1 Tax=Paenibacillus sp. YN15 TaxID=1742774 RepID=UPI000DCD0E48|nr:hypothetical protein [Paenibacillus sp. YN15]RAU99176.1 hypothetical protein DQG13_16115 [Paenibacillus sp. YN15]